MSSLPARTIALAAAAATTMLTLTACSDGGTDPGAGSRGIDARSYYDDYESPVYEQDYAGTSAPNAGAPSAVAPAAQSQDDGGTRIPGLEEENTFVDPGTSGFVSTAEDRLSTFGLDVDSGSFNVARTLLTQGQPVPAASIRPEEWINALPSAGPAPTDADLGLTTDAALAPSLDDGTELVRVGVSAREVAQESRPRVNVTLVIDRSGSMDIRERLGLVQSSLALLADRLRPDDTVSVVSFEDQARPILEPTPVSDTDAILDAIDQLKPGGSTNLEAGLELGYDQARDAFDPDAVNLVVLCSDGVANVGETGPGSLTEKITEEGADGIHLVTVGFGMGNYNDHLMEQLADLGDGFYSYVDDYAEAEQLFGTDLTTTLVPVAEEARSQVAFDPEVVSSYRLIGYENRRIADEDYEDLSVDAGELGAGHHATALYEVRLIDGVEPGTPIGTASLKWRSTRTGEAQSARAGLLAADPSASASDQLGLAGAAADLAQLLKHAAPFAERGQHLGDVAARVAELQRDDVDGADELAAMVELAENLPARDS